jgi:chaperonin GroES
LAVGAGKFDDKGARIPMQVKVGDVIYFGKYAGTELGDDHLIIREDEILGIVEK